MALYEDKFCEIHKDGTLRIKTYFFPIGTAKVIEIKDIVGVYYESQKKAGLFTVKSWGMALTPVWWACDMQRQFFNRYYNVVVHLDGERLDKGFSVIDIVKFLEAAKNFLSETAVLVDTIP